MIVVMLTSAFVLTGCASTPPDPASVTTTATPGVAFGSAVAHAAVKVAPKLKATTARPAAHHPEHRSAPKTAVATTHPAADAVWPGAFCEAPSGQVRYTAKGTAMRCTLKAGDVKARWRSA